jgi:hypothetical protein
MGDDMFPFSPSNMEDSLDTMRHVAQNNRHAAAARAAEVSRDEMDGPPSYNRQYTAPGMMYPHIQQEPHHPPLLPQAVRRAAEDQNARTLAYHYRQTHETHGAGAGSGAGAAGESDSSSDDYESDHEMPEVAHGAHHDNHNNHNHRQNHGAAPPKPWCSSSDDSELDEGRPEVARGAHHDNHKRPSSPHPMAMSPDAQDMAFATAAATEEAHHEARKHEADAARPPRAKQPRPDHKEEALPAAPKRIRSSKLGFDTPAKIAQRRATAQKMEADLTAYNADTEKIFAKYNEQLEEAVKQARDTSMTAELTRRHNGNGRRVTPKRYEMSKKDTEDSLEFHEERSTEHGFYEKSRVAANKRNHNHEEGAYSRLKQHPFMWPIMQNHKERVFKKHYQYYEATPLYLFFKGTDHDKKQLLPLFEKVMDVIMKTDTDSIMQFCEWLTTKAVNPITKNSQKTSILHCAQYVMDAPPQFNEICWMLRLTYIENVPDGETDAPVVAVFIAQFAEYVKTFLRLTDFSIFLKHTDDLDDITVGKDGVVRQTPKSKAVTSRKKRAPLVKRDEGGGGMSSLAPKKSARAPVGSPGIVHPQHNLPVHPQHGSNGSNSSTAVDVKRFPV